jgi:hypothetical protein
MADTLECPAHDSLDRLLNLGDLYLGEIHGTVEAPALLHCLVERALVRTNEDITVSLELPEKARDRNNAFWRGVDGRSSQAMWSLVAYLEAQEAKGRLKLHFQITSPPFVGADFDRRTGQVLAQLARDSLLIALSGNAHNRREPFPFNPNGTTAGMFVGRDVKTVDVEAIEGGAASVCLVPDPKSCGVKSIPKTPIEDAQAGSLLKVAGLGYDYAFFVSKFAPSPPSISGGVQF